MTSVGNSQPPVHLAGPHHEEGDWIGDSAGPGVDAIESQLPNSKLNRIGAVKSELGHDRADARASLGCVGTLPGASRRSHIPSQSVEAVKILHEDLPSSKSEVSGPVDLGQLLMHGKFNEGEFGSGLVDYKLKHEVVFSDHGSKFYSLSDSLKDACENDSDDAEFTVIDRGIEVSTKDLVKEEEDNKDAGDIPVVGNIKIDESSKGEGATGLEVVKPNQQDEAYRSNVEEFPIVGWNSQEDSLFTEELIMKELDSALCDPSILKVEESGSSHSQSEDPGQLIHTEVKSIYKKGKVGKSLSLDDATASVASEFLSLLGIEHSPFGSSSDSDPDSPRERLLKQFERDSLACGSGIFGIDIGKEMDMELVNDSVQLDPKNLSEEFELSSFVHTAEAEHQKAAQTLKNKTRAKMLEDAEAEALMREWGLNENSFQSSAPGSADGFGSPIDLPPEEPFLPPLGEGLGPLVQTKDGGFLRSMNPSLFMNAKNNGSLIMQVSSPIVVPAEMGSGIMEILQGLASIGIEKLSMQTSKLMPLEDVTGKTMQQVAWEAAPAFEACKREDTLQHLKPEWQSEVRHDAFRGRRKGKNSSTLTSSFGRDLDSEYVSLGDLAPLAMDKIEALSIEGLRIQSGMSDDEAPSNISSQSYGEISALSGQRAKGSRSLGLEGAAGLQLMDIKDGNEDVDGLMGLSITLDEWMRLDAGILDEEEQNSSRT
ncbi:hypothetical protein MRB53_030372 [Persea americana]|uniref:Uncharacterized protein n=1 Tax=Persea americana TaxID=3435 RepID=A0ACC2KLD8_PERAE|nr:hypothetical protein MRB53_030372 [Persea americana]